MNQDRPRWKVLKVTDSNEYHPTTGTYRTKQVHVQFADGATTFVDVPMAEYSPEHVHDLVSHAADLHESVMTLNPVNRPVNYDTENNPF